MVGRGIGFRAASKRIRRFGPVDPSEPSFLPLLTLQGAGRASIGGPVSPLAAEDVAVGLLRYLGLSKPSERLPVIDPTMALALLAMTVGPLDLLLCIAIAPARFFRGRAAATGVFIPIFGADRRQARVKPRLSFGKGP